MQSIQLLLDTICCWYQNNLPLHGFSHLTHSPVVSKHKMQPDWQAVHDADPEEGA